VHMAPQRLCWAPQNGGGMAAPLPDACIGTSPGGAGVPPNGGT
jgi:hypothetical protein